MAQENALIEKERDALVQCVSDAFQALHIIPGLDRNGPVLVWLADHLLEIRRREEGWHEALANGR
jgi:hypothetical protein